MRHGQVWEDGQAAAQLASRQLSLAAQREEVDAARKVRGDAHVCVSDGEPMDL